VGERSWETADGRGPRCGDQEALAQALCCLHGPAQCDGKGLHWSPVIRPPPQSWESCLLKK
jgi:hypothetical protein